MKKSAFSLVELSMVIIVIALITAGIIKASALIDNSRVSTARALTSSSKINEIDGILAWYETTLLESFNDDERVDNSMMTRWNDISSQKSLSEEKNVLTRSADNNVVYRAAGINKLPSIQFAASGRFSLAEIEQGVSSRYSVFAVLSPALNLDGVDMVFIDSYLTGSDNSISVSQDSINVISTGSISLTASFAQSQNYVVGIYLNNSNSQSFVNDVAASDSSSSLVVNGFEGLTVGADRLGSENFTGLISEIIIFNRILSDKERIMVMSYLSKKYNIRVNGAF